MSLIDTLNGYKEKLMTNNTCASEIFASLQVLIDERWMGIKDYFSEDFTLQLNEQLELLHEVSRIHREEASHALGALLRSNRSCKDIVHSIDVSCANNSLFFAANRIYAVPHSDDTTVVIIGDTHADSAAIKGVVQSADFFTRVARGEKILLLFLGDYVDRGRDPFGEIEWLLVLKYLFPQNVILLKGNHDGGYIENNGVVKTPYRIPEEDTTMDYFPPFLRRIEQENHHIVSPIVKEYFAFFEGLSIFAAVQSGHKVFFCCHGGIPRLNLLAQSKEQWFAHLPSLASLTLEEFQDEIGRSTIQNIMWCDPTEDESDLKWDTGRYKYTRDHFNVFCETFGVDVLFRGHEEEKDGVRTFFDGRVITVFSTGSEMLHEKNTISAYEGVTPKIAVVENGDVRFIRI